MSTGSNHIQNSTHGLHSWCGKPIGHEFFFVDAEVAVINGNTGGKIPPCGDCVDKIISCLTINGLIRHMKVEFKCE
jgi:predicted PP-loop superfamily ATPase